VAVEVVDKNSIDRDHESQSAVIIPGLSASSAQVGPNTPHPHWHWPAVHVHIDIDSPHSPQHHLLERKCLELSASRVPSHISQQRKPRADSHDPLFTPMALEPRGRERERELQPCTQRLYLTSYLLSLLPAGLDLRCVQCCTLYKCARWDRPCAACDAFRCCEIAVATWRCCSAAVLMHCVPVLRLVRAVLVLAHRHRG
jgi:hypothetical protein